MANYDIDATSDLKVDVAGREWVLSRASNFEELWANMALDESEDAEDHIPYWTELWPSSVALCMWLERRREEIRGRFCVDIGCGLGLSAMVAASFGAKVLGMDIEREALVHALANARENAVSSVLWSAMDWRRPAIPAGSAFRVWGGDIMYEERFVAPVLGFFAHALCPGGKAWVAEPGRSVYGAFLSGLRSGGWEGRRVFSAPVRDHYAQSRPVTAAVWEISRRGE